MTPSWYSRLALAALGRLPLHAISRAAGRFASLRLPGLLQRGLIRLFGAAVGVEWSEVRDPIASFPSLQAFFTRALAPGVRPRDEREDAFLAPCDGSWGACGRVERGTLLQVKGQRYRLAELLGSEATAADMEGGPYATLYLSPRDYHRFHAPCDVEVVSARYLPGTLWPVNRLGLEGVDGLFAQNERICAWMRVAGTDGPPGLCLVAVGATLVGSVRVAFDDLTTNVPGAAITTRSYQPPVAYARGAEWGRFEFGSTIVLLAAPSVVALDLAQPGASLRLGTRIGALLAP